MNAPSIFSGRKGFTYLLVTSLLVVVLLSVFFASSSYKYQDREELEQVRIRAMNDFMRNLNTDIHRATYISAFRAMLALEDHVTTTGQFLTHTNESFKETFFYGTINGTSSSIMENSTFNNYLLRVQEIAHSTGISLNMNVTSIRMTQSNPWFIDVYISLNITAIDNKGTASWHIEKEYLTRIPIDNLRDPLYSKNTFNRVPNTVRRMPTTVLVNGTNTSNLQTHLYDSYYLASPYAPSFLMRFEGNNNADPNGIESVVDITDLSDQEIIVYENRVKIDYIYFNDLSTDKICDVENIPESYYFVIPSDRISLYQIDSLNYSASCP